MTRIMRAMLLRKQSPVEENPLELAELEVPEPSAGEVLIRVLTCGICHTDLHTVEGDLSLKKCPTIPGHQIVGVVEKCGPGVEGLRLGDRVGVAWFHWACGKCKFCLRGDENLCGRATFTGHDVDGGYAEFVMAKAPFTYLLPTGFNSIEVAPLLCAGIIGYRALRLSESRRGDTVALYGFGASAHLSIQLALSWGLKVIVFSRSAEHRELAMRLGASWTGKTEETPPVKPERAVIFAPAGNLVRHALELVEEGGTVTLASIHMDSIPELDYEKHLYHEKKLKSVTASTRDDGRSFLEEASRISMKIETETFPLEDANRALRLLKESKINGAGVLDVDSRDECRRR